MKKKVLAGQSLLDIAIVTAGSMEVLVALAAANGISVTDSLENGQELTVTEVKRQDVVRTFAVTGTQPATAMTAEEEQLLPGGIGYMAVGVDFVVS